MTLDEFVVRSSTAILAFKAATEAQAKVDPTFYLERDENDWWREVAAYHEYVDYEEKFNRGGAN